MARTSGFSWVRVRELVTLTVPSGLSVVPWVMVLGALTGRAKALPVPLNRTGAHAKTGEGLPIHAEVTDIPVRDFDKLRLNHDLFSRPVERLDDLLNAVKARAGAR